MLRTLAVLTAGCALLAATPAHARFGKRSKTPPPSSTCCQESSNSPSPNEPSRGYESGGSYGHSYRHGYTGYRPRWSLWAGSFVPRHRVYVYSSPAPVVVGAPTYEVQETEGEEAAPSIRVIAGAEGHGYLSGFTLGVNASVEGDRWGLFVAAQNNALKADDGSQGWDHIQVVSAHLGFAFLRGELGRLRAELGADAAFAPDMISVGPTAGLSGVIYVGGPFALEGSAMLTPWPYTQVDLKAGAAIGLGPVGLKAGFRVQMLDDRGLVDGVAHRDVMAGPYVGVSLLF